MKIMWITNVIVGDLASKHGVTVTSGQWLNAELEKEKSDCINEIVVCTSGAQREELKAGNITHIVLPHGAVAHYSISEERIKDWKELFSSISPDLILVWGTEYDIGRCALIANEGKIPSVVYVQGVMSAVAEHYRGGLTNKEIAKMTTIVERVRKTTLWDIEKKHVRSAQIERDFIALSGRIIVENDWAAEQYRKALPDVRIYRNRLPIKKVFSEFPWNDEKCKRHTLITTAAAYPLKGLHQLIKALALVVKRGYQDVLLSVPGPNGVIVHGIKSKLKQSGYCRWLRRYIRKNNLEKNVVFIGPQSPVEYAKQMQSAQVFVNASAVENHCSVLREAMSVGVPCISSAVGGIPEFAKDRENASLHKYGDVAELADKICELFEDSKLRERYSVSGKETVRQMYEDNPLKTLQEIYEQIARE